MCSLYRTVTTAFRWVVIGARLPYTLGHPGPYACYDRIHCAILNWGDGTFCCSCGFYWFNGSAEMRTIAIIASKIRDRGVKSLCVDVLHDKTCQTLDTVAIGLYNKFDTIERKYFMVECYHSPSTTRALNTYHSSVFVS